MSLLYKLRCLGYVERDNYIWFPNIYFNALVKMNKETGRIESLEKFPGYDVRTQWLFSTVTYVEGHLIFVPHVSKDIVLYNIETKQLKTISMDLEIVGKENTLFGNAYVYNQYVYMFPIRSRYIVRYDVRENDIQYLDGGIGSFIKDVALKEDCFSMQYEVLDGKVYFSFLHVNAIAVFDPVSEIMDVTYLNIKGGCTTFNYHGKKFYLAATQEKMIYEWDPETLETVAYSGFPEEFEGGEYPFSCSAVMENKIFFFPLLGNMILSFHISSKEIKEEYKMQKRHQEAWNVYFTEKKEQGVLTVMADKNDFCLLRYENGELKLTPYFTQDFLYNRKIIHQYILENVYCEGNFKDEGVLKLEELIDTISDYNPPDFDDERESYGSKIYNQLCKNIGRTENE